MLTLIAAGTTAGAQSGGTVAGRVSAPDGRPLPGIQISISAMARGAATDTAGRFSVANVPPGPHTVTARGIGFTLGTAPVTVASGQTATVSITLTRTALELNPVVVVGYGEQERRTVTGAVSTVTAEKLQDIPTSDPMKALQGRVPGVDIIAANNEPGAAMNVRIRGVRSLTASNEPLYVVDGVPIGGGIQDFNPETIETIEVLKDASATAIYGSRGAKRRHSRDDEERA
jgi:TonB-dependent SusC/RagA subfamily outer membrane receptor